VTHVDIWSLGFNGMNGWDSSNPLIAANDVDYDRDGLATLWEYLQGKNPATADGESADIPDGTILEDAGNDYLELTYRRLETLPLGAIVKVQCSDDLASWPVEYVVEGAIPDPEITVTPGTPSGGMVTITVRLNAAIGTPGSLPFARLVIEEQ
jgi:hypothetical protein